MEKLKLVILAILVAILVLILGSTTKLKNARTISLTGDVTGSVSFDGSKNVSINTNLANVAILSGQVTVKKSNDPGNFYEVTRIENIEYPNGFNKDNCAVIAFGCNRTTNSNKYYGIDYNVANAVSAMVTGDIPREVNLSDKIILNFFSYSGSDITVRYEVVLMKIK